MSENNTNNLNSCYGCKSGYFTKTNETCSLHCSCKKNLNNYGYYKFPCAIHCGKCDQERQNCYSFKMRGFDCYGFWIEHNQFRRRINKHENVDWFAMKLGQFEKKILSSL